MRLATLPLKYKFLLVLAGLLCLSLTGMGGGKSGAWPLPAGSPPPDGRVMGLNECADGAGLHTGNVHDYAGLMVELKWKYQGESDAQARDAGGDIQAVVRNYNNQSDSGGNIYNPNTGARYMSGAFNLREACGRTVAVLGYTKSSNRGGDQAGPWTLDCDESIHGIGNGQDFQVTGQGVPNGARKGGTWTPKYVRSKNGYTRIVQIVYTSPPKPDTGGGCTNNCCPPGGCPPKKWELEVTTHVRKPGDSLWVTILTARPGETVQWRHGYTNYGEKKANPGDYQRKRQYNYAESGGTGPVNGWWNGNTYDGLTLEPDQNRFDTTDFTIPANAPLGTQYCQRDTVSPGQTGGTGTRISDPPACVTVTSWSLDTKTYVSTDGANWSLGPIAIEQGTTRVYFMSTITNNGNAWASSFNRTREYSHNTTNPGNPWNQTDQLTTTAGNSPPIAPGATWQSNVRAVDIPADAPLTGTATQWCERYVASPGSIYGGVSESNAACAGVVGGKTSLSMIGDGQTVEPYQTVGPIRADLSTSQFTPFAGWTGYTVGCSYSITVVEGTPGSPSGSGTCHQTIGANGTINAREFTYQAQPADVGKRICFNVNIWPANGNDRLLGSIRSGQACFRVITRPYMKIQSGDVAAGNGFLGGNCINASASVVGWNKGDDPNYAGAGATFAVFAQDRIQDFVSGQGLTRVDGFGYSPAKLSFSNTVIGGGRYGGSFGSGTCIPDYYGNMPSTAKPSWPGVNSANNDPATDQDYKVSSSNLNLSAGTIRHGSNIRLFVDGDVYISGNIVTDAAGGPVTSVASIPNFTLIVKGNIYIAPNVSQLYGTFVAQPNGGSGGNIYTCATSGKAPYNTLGPAQWYGNCQNQLVVTGSLTAKKVHFLRVKGSLYQADGGNVAGTAGYNNAAEVIQYNPLTGLRQSANEDTARSSTYDSITTLPPVLSTGN